MSKSSIPASSPFLKGLDVSRFQARANPPSSCSNQTTSAPITLLGQEPYFQCTRRSTGLGKTRFAGWQLVQQVSRPPRFDRNLNYLRFVEDLSVKSAYCHRYDIRCRRSSKAIR